MRIPSDKELRNRAYRLATGYYLVKQFTFAQFQRANVMKNVWEPFEHWDEKSLTCQIADIAEGTYKELLKLKGELT